MRLFILLSLLAFSGCGDASQPAPPPASKSLNWLPKGAVIEKDLGNHWVVFSIEGRRYVMRYASDWRFHLIAPWEGQP